MMNPKKLNTTQLLDLMRAITEYGLKTGKYYPLPRKIFQGLKDVDPFVVHEARLAAFLALDDRLLYH